MLKIGVDVGGTNTDAVLLDDDRLVASCKTATTADVETGVCDAITALLRTQALHVDAIDAVMIGTTQFTNAFIERSRLAPVGVIRIGAPATTGIPPLYGWPRELLDVVGTNVVIVGGGYEFDGRELAPLDEASVAKAARAFRAQKIGAIAISCCFAPVNTAMEHRAAEIVRNELPDARLSLSSSFGRIGLIERENAATMNASLSVLAERVVGSFRLAMKKIGVKAPFYISQNDGTLMTADDVERHPVLTFASGPTNSMRGAAFLSGLRDAIVLDIGGTTADVGQIVNAFPRESAVAVDIGGVRTNFRMPDLVSRGLGGGSLVTVAGGIRVGPRSVGFELTTKALVFGGDVLTATDIAVAAGAADIGDRSRVAHLPASTIHAALAEIHRLADEAIDQIKTNSKQVPVVLVGGGSVLISRPLASAPDIRRPENFSVANAVGAAIAQVGGEVDSVFSYEAGGRDAVLSGAKEDARRRAAMRAPRWRASGSSRSKKYRSPICPAGRVRVRVKAVGDLRAAGR